VANDVTSEEKKRALLLSVCGRETFKTARNLCSPGKLTDKAYKDICAALKGHFDPQPSAIVQRFHFNNRVRKPDESVSEYLAELRRLSEHCDYGSVLNEMLRDRLVCGINDSQIQRQLLAEANLTLRSATDIALASESAASFCKLLETAAPSCARPDAPVLKLQHNAEEGKRCGRCLSTRHHPSKCPFLSRRCFNCNKTGHSAKACKQPKQQQDQQHQAHQLEEGAGDGTPEAAYSLYHIGSGTPLASSRVPPYTTLVLIDGKECEMEIDTGASVSLVSAQTYQKTLQRQPALQSTEMRLNTYSGQAVKILGQLTVTVKVAKKDASFQLPLLVVEGNGPSLLGRDWLRCVQLDWPTVKRLSTSMSEQVEREFPEIFKSLGTFSGRPLSISVKAGAQPKFFKARAVPFALKDKVEQQLRKEMEQGVLYPVKSSDWASPIVPVMKSDGSVRVCADFKQTVNAAVEPDGYPLPNINELFSRLSGGQRFSKLDLSQAFSQMPLNEAAQQLCTINTSMGLLRYSRLPFGISTAPSMFQRVMDSLLTGIEHCAAFMDDVIVTGRNDESHLQNLRKVLSTFKEAGLTCSPSKCSFLQESVVYLGHRIDAEGLHPLKEKVQAILAAPTPQNCTQLRSFLGLVNYYGKFLPNLSDVLGPLHFLLSKDTKWQWKRAQEQAFERCKQMLVEPGVLVHFDASLELFLECDASDYGLGAVIFHRIDGSDRPVAYASRTLCPAERNYCQLEKEALALVFGVKKFHHYLLGREFGLLTDHRPLLGLLGEDRPIPALASGRVQRWALLLSAYRYRLVHRKGSSLLKADALSRLPMPECPKIVPTPPEVALVMDSLDASPVTTSDVRVGTRRDPQLSQVVRCCLSGCWPDPVPSDLQPFSTRSHEMSVQDGCLLWGGRVVIPAGARTQLLQCLHQGHAGASRMKALARGSIWWPGMDRAIEKSASACLQCQQLRPEAPASPLLPWPAPAGPWQRVHVDFAGPVNGRMLLVVVDAFSKWLDVHITATTTASAAIEKLRQSFCTHGLPETLVSDNGPCFASNEFSDFCRRNGVRHVLTPPYHPASNGLAERAVQSLKRSLKRQDNGTLEAHVSRFLLSYRVTPHSTTGVPPCELLMRRTLRSLLDCVRPNLPGRILEAQERQKRQHDRSTVEREFTEGERIFCRDFCRGSDTRWIPAVVERSEPGQRWFTCRLPDGQTTRRHADHMRIRSSDAVAPCDDGTVGASRDEMHRPTAPDSAVSASGQANRDLEPQDRRTSAVTNSAATDGSTDSRSSDAAEGPRRSGRVRNEPDRLRYD
jgi:transposase InsO family protein